MNAPVPPPPSVPPDEMAGLPFARTWREVYYLVLATFAFWVIFLTLLPQLFS